jgi:hypothetical protein
MSEVNWSEIPGPEVDFAVQVWEDEGGWLKLDSFSSKEDAVARFEARSSENPDFDYRIVSRSMLSWVALGDIHKAEGEENG